LVIHPPSQLLSVKKKTRLAEAIEKLSLANGTEQQQRLNRSHNRPAVLMMVIYEV